MKQRYDFTFYDFIGAVLGVRRIPRVAAARNFYQVAR
jgi:hypothetical protein